MKRFALPAIMAFLAGGLWLAAETPKPEPNLEQLLKKASINGKYRMLIGQIKVEDEKDAGDFKDLGMQSRTEYAGHTDLPRGYWVYAKPYWYIWRDLSSVAEKRMKRAWGPEQATGEPDTQGAGDIQTAWASQSQDDQDEWLLMEYAEPIVPTAVLVHETYNPGALVRVTAFKLDGTEVELWKGQDPTGADNESGVSEVPVKADFKTNRIKIYIASKDVPGWNEIDAVGVRDRSNKMHWATSAHASSTYAPPFEQIEAAPPPPLVSQASTAQYEMRIKKLEDELTALKSLVEELKKKVEKKDK
jgi:hypothetical protein